MEQPRIQVPPEISQVFTEVAQGTRLIAYSFWSSDPDPAPGSSFDQVNRLYPFEKVSDRARHYVSAAIEHMNMWADFVAPRKFHPEQTTLINMRPVYALSRAALETAAQAVWLMDTPDPLECVRRHLSLIRWDLEEHRKSRSDPNHKARVNARDKELLDRVAGVFAADQIKPPAGYLKVITEACRPDDLKLDAADAERVWRAMSGAAHGMYWTNLDLTVIERGDEYEPGHFRTRTLPDPEGMAEALRAAETIVTYAALRFLDYLGADIPALLAGARRQLACEITLKDGEDPEVRERLAGGSFGQVRHDSKAAWGASDAARGTEEDLVPSTNDDQIEP